MRDANKDEASRQLQQAVLRALGTDATDDDVRAVRYLSARELTDAEREHARLLVDQRCMEAP